MAQENWKRGTIFSIPLWWLLRFHRSHVSDMLKDKWVQPRQCWIFFPWPWQIVQPIKTFKLSNWLQTSTVDFPSNPPLSSTNFNISLLNYSSSISFKPLNLFPLISLNTHGSSSGYHWNTNNSYSPFQLCPGWWSISHNSEAPLEFWDGKWIMHLSLFKIYQSKNKTD